MANRYGAFRVLAECPWCIIDARGDEISALPMNSSVVALIAPADRDFLSNMLWARAVYYVGAQTGQQRPYPSLFPILDIITELSPRWKLPYIFGGLMLSSDEGTFDDAMFLIEKGIVTFADDWRFWYYKGIFLLKYQNDKIQAAKAFKEAALQPGVPGYLKGLPITLLLEEGNSKMAELFYLEISRSLHDDEMRLRLMNKFLEKPDADG